MEPGSFGHVAVILAFTSCLYGIFSYFLSLGKDGKQQEIAFSAGKWSFFLHAASVMSVVTALFYLIYSHQYQYHYAWSHSSSRLPVYYMISCFWEGQEGSFLLWIFWHMVLGFFILNAKKEWRAQLWVVFFSVQAFLLSMLLGVEIPGWAAKIGSSPFVLLKEVQKEAPVFMINPNYVPEDGRGLNPLLQNYWMVIHPPTLFLGFALSLIPFCYAIAALWTKRFTEWVKPALAWTSLAAGVMGIGIAMGAYWAYETLNFGGYWNWDPVENAVYIPWLILVAALHVLLLFQSKKTGLGTAFILVISAFVLVLYATFLTRSGILGNASVHSFTDLGLSGQLMLYLLAYLACSSVLMALRWKEIPHSPAETETWSKEFWISTGVLILCLASFQVLASTSIPVYNAIAKAFGGELNMAPPSDPLKHYSYWQMGFFMLITILTGIGQFFFWQGKSAREIFKKLSIPLNIALLISIALIVFTGVNDWELILFLAFSLFGLAANTQMLIKTVRQKPSLSGGALSHVGLALVLIGILYSAGYSKVVSVNTSGKVYRKDFSEEMNRDNLFMARHESIKMGPFTMVYKGPRYELKSGEYIRKDMLMPLENQDKAVLADSVLLRNGWKKAGDTLDYFPENTYYEIAVSDTAGEKFKLHPRAQVNPNMGLIASPDIRKYLSRDLYTHVSSIPDPEEEIEFSEPQTSVVHMGDTFFAGDQVAVLENVRPVQGFLRQNLGPVEAAVEAVIKVMGPQGEVFRLKPVFLIRNHEVGVLPDISEDAGLRISLSNIKPESREFTLSVETFKKDWIIFKALEKPGINVLWMGVLVMTTGFGFSVRRRFLVR
jgi:cytochrome c-type biogenesis protein CcmF